jgi:hypothetical protein
MAIHKIYGAKNGDLGQFPTLSINTSVSPAMTTHNGESGRCLRVNAGLSGTGYATINRDANETGISFAFRAGSLPTNTEVLFRLGTFHLMLDSSGTFIWRHGFTPYPTTVTTTAGAWNWVTIKAPNEDLDPEYGNVQTTIDCTINGTEICTGVVTQSGSFVGSPYELGKVVNTNGASADFTYDDVMTFTALGEYPMPESYVAMRKFVATAPTYDQFTKSNGSTIDTVWGDTPFSATTYAISPTSANPAQTAHFADITDKIGASDTILGFKIGAVAKCSATSSSGGVAAIRYRIGSTDTDIGVTNLTSGDTYRENLIPAVITGLIRDDFATLQVGWKKNNTSTRTQTVEDMWVFVAYQPPSGPTSIVVTPAALTVKAATVAPSVQLGSITLDALLAAAAALTINPTVTIGTNFPSIAITPAAITAAIAALNPFVVLGSLSLSAGAVLAKAASVAPSVQLGSLNITPSAIAAKLATLTPVVHLGSLNITPGFASSRLSTFYELGGALVTPAAAIARLATLNPSVTLSSLLLTAQATAKAATVNPSVQQSSISITPNVAALRLATFTGQVIQGSVVVAASAVTTRVLTVNPTVKLGDVVVLPAALSARLGAMDGETIQMSLWLTPGPVTCKLRALDPVVIAGALHFAFEVVAVTALPRFEIIAAEAAPMFVVEDIEVQDKFNAIVQSNPLFRADAPRVQERFKVERIISYGGEDI